MEHQGVRGRVMRNAPMSRYTSMKVGGPAPYLFYPENEKEIVTVMKWLQKRGTPFRFLGNGTNVIVADKGVDAGIVRITRIRHLRFRKEGGGVLVEAAGGMPLRALISECQRRCLSGIEKLYGIPGTVGGAVRMNAGSFGVSISDRLTSVRVIDRDGARMVRKEDIEFGYRRSSFGDGQCIVGATFELEDGDPDRIKAEMEGLWRLRMQKHPVEFPSAGSVFKNGDGIACWRLIEQAGLRGLEVGGARVSEKHANFIVNGGGARAADVKGLIETVKTRVRETTGFVLEEEVELWGF
jgi:UDP-N-acetylmuramate dehydrogenase